MAKDPPRRGTSGSSSTKRQRKRPLEERIAIHHEWAKTARWGIVASAIVAAIWIITNALVKLLQEPSWLTALKLVLALVAALGLPSVIIVRVLIFVRKFTRRTVARTAQLEAQIDPGRTSSALRDDGTDHPGALT